MTALPRPSLVAVKEYQRLKPGGLMSTLAGWEQAIGAAREYTAHPIINMSALDGAPRITHIWGYASRESRRACTPPATSLQCWVMAAKGRTGKHSRSNIDDRAFPKRTLR